MSHRTRLAPNSLIWSQEFGQQSLRRKDALPTISYLGKVFDFRTHWLYSNWGYALANEVITTLSGESWGTMLKNEIFDPLEMPRTITEHNTDLDNVAEAIWRFVRETHIASLARTRRTVRSWRELVLCKVTYKIYSPTMPWFSDRRNIRFRRIGPPLPEIP